MSWHDFGGLAWVSHSQEDREAKDLKMDRSSKEKLSPCAIPASVRPGGQAGVLPRGCGGVGGGPVPGSGFRSLPSLLLSVGFETACFL